jgi:hypothetical protein
MDDQGTIEIEEARMRRLLQHAANDIGGSQPEPRRVKRPRGRRTATVVAITVFALAASAGTGFAFGRAAPANTVRLASLPSEPPLVEAALQEMFQQRDPQIVQRVASVVVKYVTDQEFWHAISSAWKSGNPAACGTFSGPSGAIGHWYVVDLHGKFIAVSAPGIATKYVSVAVVMVPATDLQAYLSSLPAPRVPASKTAPGQSNGGPIAPPAPSGARTNVSASNFGFPPVGTDGEPLCWSLLPSGS